VNHTYDGEPALMKIPAGPIPITEWHSIQAAMLYSDTPTDRLKLLHGIVTQFIDGLIDPLRLNNEIL